MKNKLLALLASSVMAVGGLSVAANATGGDDPEPCVPSDAWTETIEHPEVSHEETVVVVDEEAWTETIPAVAGFWQNFSPNKQNRPFTGPPSWPTDPRGTWQGPHTNGGPQPEAEGVFQNGNGNGSWFYRSQGTPEQVIEHPAVTHEETITVVDEEAYTEVIEHDAVVCEDDEEPTVTETSSTSYECGDAFQVVTTVTTTTLPGEEPVVETSKDREPVEVVPCEDDPEIEQPGPGEEITYQAFDGNGELVEQRVSAPISEEAKQEGM